MRRTLALAAGSLLLATALSAAPCTPSGTTLCLNDSRFEVEVSWRDSRGRTGAGQAKTITADTGYFWFFSETNIELVIKVLDARSINQKYWVFFGALTSVEFDLTVTDTVTGAVKTYHNPLGQFASVGDTQAFDPGPGVRAATETVEVQGTLAPLDSLEAVQKFIDAVPAASAAFTPCVEESAYLYLAGCRFRLEVHWTDARGRHGAGQPVQLTNDTGYFWFFSEENVELMVKVLDARGINDRFWVFFGALSNVEYTINVVDTVSGEVHSYQNPQATFASVGDTSAFRGGYGISVETEASMAVTGEMTVAQGGSLSVAAADGTVFTLDVPPQSLLVDEAVTMTPVRSASHVPFAGGLAAGVVLEPSGTLLLEGATLSIHPPAPLSGSEETAVAWNGSGEDFFLFPPEPAAGDLQLSISHFGGYGVARGTDAERQAQLGREPLALQDLFRHEISPMLRAGRGESAGGMVASTRSSKSASQTSDWRSDLVGRLEDQYQLLRVQMQTTTGDPRTVQRLIIATIQWRREVLRLGLLVELLPAGRSEQIATLFKTMMRAALRNIHERCSQNAIAIFDIFPLVQIGYRHRIIQTPPNLQADVESVFGCLKFKLKFESTIVASGPSGSFTTAVLADAITLRGRFLETEEELKITGEGSIEHTKVEMTPIDECVTLVSWTPSTFKAELFWASDDQIRMPYDRGTPHDEIKVSCRGSAPSTIGFDFWLGGYDFTHREQDTYNADGYTRIQRDWTLTGRKDPWAVSVIATTRRAGPVTTAEITRFTLTHTPE